ncbi:MAG: HAMP domain-containing sensor histidine kinase [Candidatus Sumerlaeota bacterium]
MAKWKKTRSGALPISWQTLLVVVTGLIVAGSISVFGSAYTVNRLNKQLVESTRADMRRMMDRVGAQAAEIIQERGVSTINDIKNDPEFKRVLAVLSDQITVRSLELHDADGYLISSVHYDHQAGPDGTITSRIDLRVPQDAPPRPKGDVMAMPIRSDNYLRGHINVEIAPEMATGGVQMLSDQISSSLRMMVFNVLGIILLMIIVLYYVLRRQMELQARATEAEHLANLGTLAGGLAHEIRNPLHAMNLHLESVREDLEEPPATNREAAKVIGHVQQQIESLNSIVSNFVNLAIPGRVQLQPMRFDQKVREIVSFLRPEFDSRGVSIIVNLSDPMMILGDAHALHQVIINLLQNARQAVENRKNKCVTIQNRRDRKHLRLIVEDSGPGIPKGEEENIFKAFVSKRTGGTGFGLYIARMIMERHGGRIYAERSESLGGAMFILEFPEHDSALIVEEQNPVTVG